MSEPQVYTWPTDEYDYWWMEWKPARKVYRVLVTIGISDISGEYVQPIDDNNCFCRGMLESGGARFIPCRSPPIFPDRNK